MELPIPVCAENTNKHGKKLVCGSKPIITKEKPE